MGRLRGAVRVSIVGGDVADVSVYDWRCTASKTSNHESQSRINKDNDYASESQGYY
jgi:hypothetical protein